MGYIQILFKLAKINLAHLNRKPAVLHDLRMACNRQKKKFKIFTQKIEQKKSNWGSVDPAN